jgi:hypothetical protein
MDMTAISEHKTELVVEGKVRGSEKLRVGYYVFDNDTPDHNIVAEYVLDDEYQKAVIEIPISFCPFCGRKLP